MNRGLWYILGGLALVCLVFQVFFRYEYIHFNSGRVMQIDRLTRASCNLPCEPTSRIPIATPTPYDAVEAYNTISSDFDERNEQAAELAKRAPDARPILQYFNGPDYRWTAKRDPLYAGFKAVASPTAKNFVFTKAEYDAYPRYIHRSPVLVCYCNEKGAGRYWEVHLGTGRVYSVTDNEDLAKKYGLGSPVRATP